MADIVSIRILGSDIYKLSGATALYSESKEKILINCSEGTQRLGTQYNLKLSKVSTIILTSLNADVISGLYGFFLTIESIESLTFAFEKCKTMQKHKIVSDDQWIVDKLIDSDRYYRKLRISKNNNEPIVSTDSNTDYENFLELSQKMRYLRIYAPTNFMIYIKSFISLKNRLSNLALEVYEYHSDCDIKYHPLSSLKSRLKLKVLIIEHDSIAKTQKNCAIQTDTQQKKRRLVKNENLDRINILYCKSPDVKGKLLIDKLKDYCDIKGPFLKQLKEGQDVELEHYGIIKASDVCEPPIKGLQFALIYINEFSQIENLKKKQIAALLFELDFVIHQSPHEIVNSLHYLEVFNEITKKHYFVSDEPWNLIGSPYYSHVALLQYIKKNISYFFPFNIYPRFVKNAKSNFLSKITIDKTQKLKFENDCNFSDLINEKLQKLTLNDHNDEIQTGLEMGFSDFLSKIDEKIYLLILGSGSAIPNKYRNVSSTLLIIKNHYILLDCGEGTLNQLSYLFTNENELILFFKKLKTIFVSHLHADHFAGLPTIIQIWNEFSENREKIMIVAPVILKSWIFDICGFEGIFMESDMLNMNKTNLNDSGTLSIETCPVNHIKINSNYEPLLSFGCILYLNNVKLIAFTGDMAPTEEFYDAALNVKIMIHEATFADELLNEAIDRKHCTISQAINGCLKTKASLNVLTHFSQRYPTNVPIDSDKKVICGLDHLLIDLTESSLNENLIQSQKMLQLIVNIPK